MVLRCNRLYSTCILSDDALIMPIFRAAPMLVACPFDPTSLDPLRSFDVPSTLPSQQSG